MSGRIFGTDGIRGHAGEGWLETGMVSALGRALGEVLPAGAKPRAILGHDGRRSGPQIEGALARGLAMAGFTPCSTGLITTPGLAILTRLGEFDLGVMISASHNPASDNGIKVFAKGGEKLSDEIEMAIEEHLRANLEPVEDGPIATLDTDLELQYLNYLIDHAAKGLKLDGMSIALDCANGGGSRIAPRVFGRLGARMLTLGAEPDGDNINAGCGSTHPAALQELVRSQGAAIGVALDGDGDRCILVDERGELVHGDGIMTAVARHAADRSDWADPRVVATIMSNRGLHRALREVEVSVVTVGVGDRRVVEELRKESLKLGGEQSGHIVFGDDHFYIGDGIYTALRVLAIMRETGKPLSELTAPYEPYPQVLVNVRVASKPELTELPDVSAACRAIEEELGEDGRVLLRYSGTEPLMRVMVEGPNHDRIREQAQELAGLIDAQIGQTSTSR